MNQARLPNHPRIFSRYPSLDKAHQSQRIFARGRHLDHDIDRQGLKRSASPTATVNASTCESLGAFLRVDARCFATSDRRMPLTRF